MMKTYVLDTSVLLNAGKSALYAFGEHEVIVPIGVVRQLEHGSKDAEFGLVARSVLREIEALRSQNESDNILGKGVRLNDDGGVLRIEPNHRDPGKSFPPSAAEASNTLKVAYNLSKEHHHDPEKEIVLVSNDLTQRIIANQALDLSAEPYNNKLPQGNYTGVSYVNLSSDDALQRFYENSRLSIEEVPEAQNVPNNHGFVLQSGNAGALAVKRDNHLMKVVHEKAMDKVQGKSVEQKIAIDHLLNPDIDIVSLGGPAGTGKTLLSLAAGYKQLQSEDSQYTRMIVFRPLHEVGKQELGFLPGTEAEKMEPWAQAVKDALGVFLNNSTIERAMEKGTIEVSPTSFIRGRTINNAFIIIDEAQNFEKLTLLSILSRLGQGSKCVLSWDAAQRDNLYINKNDGVVAVVDRLKEEDMVAHVTLNKSERSRAAELATRVLDELDY